MSVDQSRIDALADIGLIISKYIEDNAADKHKDDSYNPAGLLEGDKLDTPFGWEFKTIPKPTIDQLESYSAIVAQEVSDEKTKSDRLKGISNKTTLTQPEIEELVLELAKRFL